METRKVKTTMTKEEYDKIFDKDIPNVIGLKQQEDGSFKCESPHDILPLCIFNEILSQLHDIYKNMMFDKACDNLPEVHKKYQLYLEKKCRIQKRWTLFWYAVALAAILYIIMGGC
jgi:hypothetical protein